MNVKRIIKKPRVTKTRIKLTSFENGLNLKHDSNITPLTYATNLYNFKTQSGALTGGLGISYLTAALYPSLAQQTQTELAKKSVIGSYYLKQYDQDLEENKDKLAVVFNDFKMGYLPLNPSDVSAANMLNVLPNVSFTSKPVAANYRLNSEDCTIFSSPTDTMTVWPTSSNIFKVIDAPNISSMCVHYERLFATIDKEQTSVWFSDDLDPTNWSLSLTEAGFIDMQDERGALKKVISFNDYVYVFRDYGIARISAYGDQTNFSVAQLFISSGKIYTNTVVLCGDVVFFLASDGLYRFDGLNCTKILDSIAPGFSGVDNSNAEATYFENNYYLACNFNFKDSNAVENDFNNNCLIKIDINKLQTTFLRGADIISISSVNSDFFCGVIVCAKTASTENYQLGVVDNSGALFGSNLTKVWESPLTDLGYPERQKNLSVLFITSSGSATITFEDENGKNQSYKLEGKTKASKISMRFPFNKLKFRIESTDPLVTITNPYCLIKMSEV